MNNNDILKKAVKRWGNENQCRMATEEAGELIVAINHYWRGRVGGNKVAEEVADMIIMCNQLKLIFGESLVDQIVAEKMNRLLFTVNN